MKKRITKFKLEELAKEMPILSEIAKRNIVGGQNEPDGNWKLYPDGRMERIGSNLDGSTMIQACDSNGVGKSGASYYSNDLKIDNTTENDSCQFSSSGANMSLFKFLCANTSVEYAYMCKNNLNSSNGLIRTDYDPDSVNLISGEGDNVEHNIFIHNHDSSSPYMEPSGQDKRTAADIDYDQNGKDSFYIYNENTGNLNEYSGCYY